MLKKILNSLIVTSLLLILGVGNVFAAENTGNELKHSTKNIDKKEYKKMMEIVKNKVKQGEEDEIERLPEVINFKKKYSQNQINEFMKSTDAFQKENVSDYSNLEVGQNEEKIIEFDDGSFIVLSSTTESIPTPITKGEITPLASHTGTVGKSYKTDYVQKWYGIYLAMEAHLITRYTVYKDKINIYDTDHAGTRAITPTTVDQISTRVVTNNKKTVQSKGSYRKTNGVVIGGQPIGKVTYHTLRTTISITSVSGSTVKFTTKSVTE